MQLLSLPHLQDLPTRQAVAKVGDMESEIIELFRQVSRDNSVHLIGGSYPVRMGGTTQITCPIVFPDGMVHSQPKLHITPWETDFWGIVGGDALHVIDTPKARIGVLICYDSEFPEAARYLADQGAEIVFVPYCTVDGYGHNRVRICSRTRAIENQLYVATAGLVGNLPGVEGMDTHYAQSGIFSPSDIEFPHNGIHTEAERNVETLVVGELDISALHRNRETGTVRPLVDRRRDLFDIQTHLNEDHG